MGTSIIKYKFLTYLFFKNFKILYKIFKFKLNILYGILKFNIFYLYEYLNLTLFNYPYKSYKFSSVNINLLDFTYYYLNVDFLNNYKSFFKNFLNKFMRSGKRYLVEKKFDLMLTSNKNSCLFIYLFDSLEYLKPFINIKLFTFKQKGKKKSVKKGKKVKNFIKVVPEQIGHIKSYKVA